MNIQLVAPPPSFFLPVGHFSISDNREISQIEGAVPSDNSIYDTFLIPASDTEM